jgi:hypothetical protein
MIGLSGGKAMEIKLHRVDFVRGLAGSICNETAQITRVFREKVWPLSLAPVSIQGSSERSYSNFFRPEWTLRPEIIENDRPGRYPNIAVFEMSIP